MSDISDELRAEVAARAGSSCEYCLLPMHGQVAWFPIDHIVPRSRGGITESGNLALACPRCNGHKWAFETGTDPETGDVVPLFHPRQQLWTDHFCWSETSEPKIQGITPCGRATIERLKLNDQEVVSIRQILIELGIRFRHRER